MTGTEDSCVASKVDVISVEGTEDYCSGPKSTASRLKGVSKTTFHNKFETTIDKYIFYAFYCPQWQSLHRAATLEPSNALEPIYDPAGTCEPGGMNSSHQGKS